MAVVTVRRIITYTGEEAAVRRTLANGQVPASGHIVIQGKPDSRSLVIKSSVGPPVKQRKEKT